MSLEKLISEIASSHPVATRANRVTGITHRVGTAQNTADTASQSAQEAFAEASRANTAVIEAAATAQQAGEDARQAGADVLDTINRIESGELKTYLNFSDYVNAGKLAGQITGVYIADLAVSRAKIADAAINSAKIANLAVNSQHVNELTASKITSGDITASLVTITGRLEAGSGGVRLDGQGLALSPVEDTGGAPASRAGQKITNLGAGKWTALFPFEGGGVRGFAVRSDGAASGANGRVDLIATVGGDREAVSTGRIRVDSGGNGNVLISGDATFNNSIGVERDVHAGRIIGPLQQGAYRAHILMLGQFLSANTDRTVTHGLPNAPEMVEVQVDLENQGNWRTASHSTVSGFTWWATNTEVVFRNVGSTAIRFRATMCRYSTT